MRADLRGAGRLVDAERGSAVAGLPELERRIGTVDLAVTVAQPVGVEMRVRVEIELRADLRGAGRLVDAERGSAVARTSQLEAAIAAVILSRRGAIPVEIEQIAVRELKLAADAIGVRRRQCGRVEAQIPAIA